MKKYILLITQNRENDIKELTSNIYPTFDGIIACVHKPIEDNTAFILESKKGCGKIVYRDFFPYHHAHSMNELFFCRHLKQGDAILILDSPERVQQSLLDNFDNTVDYMVKNGVDAIFGDGRPYILIYNYQMMFNYGVHWAISGINNALSWTKEQKNSFIINKRHEEPWKSFSYNPSKYYFVYGAGNNEILATYGKYGMDIVNCEEDKRVKFRLYCEKELCLSLNSLDDLISYMTKVNNKEIIPSEYFADTVHEQFRLYELFRLKVLNQDFMGKIVPNRFSWSFKEYLKSGDKEQKNSNNKGQIMLLNDEFGYKNE